MPTPAHTRQQADLERELGGGVTCDGLTRDFVIFQRSRGHRHSTDDLLTAWYAATHLPSPLPSHLPSQSALRLLDLGTGIGSIGLSLLWLFPTARLTAIEAQPVSFRLFQANIEANGVAARIDARMGDLRDTELSGSFDLVTGSPPYFDVQSGIVSSDSQRAHARFELRGDIRDYARAAVRWLAPSGRFVFCFPAVQRARAIQACTDAGLSVVCMREVVPKERVAPLFGLFACALASEGGAEEPLVEPPFVVRDAAGAHTPELTAARALFGMQ